MRLIDLFDRGVAISPDRVCLKDDRTSLSFSEVKARSCRFANAIAAAGYSPGQKAAIYSPNCVEGFVAMIGLFRSGVAWVPVNAKNAVAENTYILDAFDVEILFYHSDFEAILDRIRADCPKIRELVCIDRTGSSAPAMQDWWAEAPATDPDVALKPGDLVGILSSGGTTGRPKGIMLTQLNWVTMIANYYATVDPGPDPVHLCVAPMTHAAGVLALTLMAASTLR